MGLVSLLSSCYKLLLLVNTHKITWIDLSFNKIKQLTDDLVHLTGLKVSLNVIKIIVIMRIFQVLYLHSNLLSSVKVISVLSTLSRLNRLTLHCNPLATKPGYRPQIIATLPRYIIHYTIIRI